jgi:hypothetical protein
MAHRQTNRGRVECILTPVREGGPRRGIAHRCATRGSFRDPNGDDAPGLAPPDLRRRREAQLVEMQEESARLSTNGSLVVATRSAQCFEIDRSDVVMAAVRKVVGPTGSRARWMSSKFQYLSSNECSVLSEHSMRRCP